MTSGLIFASALVSSADNAGAPPVSTGRSTVSTGAPPTTARKLTGLDFLTPQEVAVLKELTQKRDRTPAEQAQLAALAQAGTQRAKLLIDLLSKEKRLKEEVTSLRARLQSDMMVRALLDPDMGTRFDELYQKTSRSPRETAELRTLTQVGQVRVNKYYEIRGKLERSPEETTRLEEFVTTAKGNGPLVKALTTRLLASVLEPQREMQEVLVLTADERVQVQNLRGKADRSASEEMQLAEWARTVEKRYSEFGKLGQMGLSEAEQKTRLEALRRQLIMNAPRITKLMDDEEAALQQLNHRLGTQPSKAVAIASTASASKTVAPTHAALSNKCPYIKLTDCVFSPAPGDAGFKFQYRYQIIGRTPVVAFELAVRKYDTFKAPLPPQFVLVPRRASALAPGTLGSGTFLCKDRDIDTATVYVRRVRLGNGTIWNVGP